MLSSLHALPPPPACPSPLPPHSASNSLSSAARGPGAPCSAPETFSVEVLSLKVHSLHHGQKLEDFHASLGVSISERDMTTRQKAAAAGAFALDQPLAFSTAKFELKASLTGEHLSVELWDNKKIVDGFEAR